MMTKHAEPTKRELAETLLDIQRDAFWIEDEDEYLAALIATLDEDQLKAEIEDAEAFVAEMDARTILVDCQRHAEEIATALIEGCSGVSASDLTHEEVAGLWSMWGVSVDQITEIAYVEGEEADRLMPSDPDEEPEPEFWCHAAIAAFARHMSRAADIYRGMAGWYRPEKDSGDEWTDEDEKALKEFSALLATDAKSLDDFDVVAWEASTQEPPRMSREWTEWVVLAGECEAIADEGLTGAFCWVPDPIRGGGVWGDDMTFASRQDAMAVFDMLDPMAQWTRARRYEARHHQHVELERRFDVELICQTCCADDEAGCTIVRDDDLELRKSFDIIGDEKAQALMLSVLGGE